MGLNSAKVPVSGEGESECSLVNQPRGSAESQLGTAVSWSTENQSLTAQLQTVVVGDQESAEGSVDGTGPRPDSDETPYVESGETGKTSSQSTADAVSLAGLQLQGETAAVEDDYSLTSWPVSRPSYGVSSWRGRDSYSPTRGPLLAGCRCVGGGVPAGCQLSHGE
ncbi:UNVERIFIED_CONTAM: hypothetical protein FKN15_052318 [Acipenser sinensis]